MGLIFFQNSNGQGSFSFIDFLINNKEYSDAEFLLKKELKSRDLSFERKDSANYYLGWNYYLQKSLDSSNVYLNKVSSGSPFYDKSKLFSIFNSLHQKRYKEAEISLINFSPKDSVSVELKKMEYAAFYLLSGKINLFDSLYKEMVFSRPEYKSELEDLNVQKENLASIKTKKEFVAGFLSALVPGLGKWYAGYRGVPVSTLIPSLILGAVAAEQLLKMGVVAPGFIFFGGLFGVFYMGNIWGSVIAVRTAKILKQNEIINDILLDVHIPLRRVFNE